MTTEKLEDQTVTAEKIQDEAVEERHLAPQSVSTLHLNDGAVTREKLADQVVTEEKIANQSIGLEKLNFNPFASPFQFGVGEFQLPEGKQITSKVIQINQPFANTNYVVVAMPNQANLICHLLERSLDTFTLCVERVKEDLAETTGSFFWIAIGSQSASPTVNKKFSNLTYPKRNRLIENKPPHKTKRRQT